MLLSRGAGSWGTWAMSNVAEPILQAQESAGGEKPRRICSVPQCPFPEVCSCVLFQQQLGWGWGARALPAARHSLSPASCRPSPRLTGALSARLLPKSNPRAARNLPFKHLNPTQLIRAGRGREEQSQAAQRTGGGNSPLPRAGV